MAESLLADILRILTPEEISDLTTASSGKNHVELTSLLDDFESGENLFFGEDSDDEGAKILPFVRKEEKADDVNVVHKAGKEVCEYVEHYIQKVKMGNTALRSNGEKVETSIFILKEKERFKYVQSKLKQREVMGLYLKNAGVDIEQEKTIKDDLSKSSRTGVLINKKQF